MKDFIIKKGSPQTMYIFILTGVFLICSFGYLLFEYLQTNEFITDFPGDWDKPIAIAIGIYLIVRSRKFAAKAKDLFIRVSDNQLIYRTKSSNPISKIKLEDIEKIQGEQDKVVVVTKQSTKLDIDLEQVRFEEDKKAIRKFLLGLN